MRQMIKEPFHTHTTMNRPFDDFFSTIDMDKLGKLWKTNEVAAPQSREILLTFIWWGNKFAPQPPNTNVGKFLQLCDAISSLDSTRITFKLGKYTGIKAPFPVVLTKFPNRCMPKVKKKKSREVYDLSFYATSTNLLLRQQQILALLSIVVRLTTCSNYDLFYHSLPLEWLDLGKIQQEPADKAQTCYLKTFCGALDLKITQVLGLYNFVKGSRRAYKQRGLYQGELMTGLKKGFKTSYAGSRVYQNTL